MSHQVALDVKAFFAQVAPEWRLAGVRSTVYAERGSRGEAFAAAVARVRATHPRGGRCLQLASAHTQFLWHKFQSFLGFLDGGCSGRCGGQGLRQEFLVS